MKPGGNDGGSTAFVTGMGLILVALGMYLFLDSVRVTSASHGLVSGRMSRGGSGLWETTSMGIIFVPFLIGIGVLFFDADRNWAWWVAGIGLAIIVIEILSRVRFEMTIKTTHLLLLLGMVAGGAGLLTKSYFSGKIGKNRDKEGRLGEGSGETGKD